jgi:hypothetical protein
MGKFKWLNNIEWERNERMENSIGYRVNNKQRFIQMTRGVPKNERQQKQSCDSKMQGGECNSREQLEEKLFVFIKDVHKRSSHQYLFYLYG